MNTRAIFWPSMLLLSIMLAGCDPGPPVATAPSGPPAPPPPPGSAPPPPPVAATAPPTAAPLPPETKVGVFAGTLDDLAARPTSPPSQPGTESTLPPTEAGVERVKAEKGVGIKGRSLDEHEGIVVTPVKAFFAAKERIVFEAQFPHQYNIYKALENPAPKDFDDLKAKVLDPYQIKLPPLPPGHKYVWDGGKEELLVERPKK